MQTDHVVALMGKVLEKANLLIIEELEKRGHPNLVPSHGGILAKLFAEGPLPMNVLSEAINRKKNTVTTLVKKLETEGYVSRCKDSKDSRVILVSLTPKGESFRKDFQEVSDVLLASVWGTMPKKEREMLVAGLEKVATNLE